MGMGTRRGVGPPQRHALIDGATGDRDAPSGFYGNTDDEYRTTYLARVRGEIDTPSWWDYIRTRGKQWS